MTKHGGMLTTKGFTIVELLIVVVVIAILATVTIVAYNGIQNRANDTSVQNDLQQLAKQVELYRGEFGSLPRQAQFRDLTIKAAKSSYALALWTDGGGTNYNLLYCTPTNNDGAYTLTARSKSGNVFRYGSSGAGEYTISGSPTLSAQVCSQAGVPIPTADDDNRQILYYGGWQSWVN